MSKPLKNIVIIGGGVAGTNAARELWKKIDKQQYNVILINDRPFYYHLLAGIRMTVSPVDTLEEKALIPYDKFFAKGNGTFTLGKVVGVTNDEATGQGSVQLESGEVVPFHYLLLASGSSWTGSLNLPLTKAESVNYIQSWRAKFEKAEDIVIVGGGAVGIEFAGEIKDIWPTKNVTIIHGSNKLLNSSYVDRFRDSAAKSVESRNVVLLLNDYLDNLDIVDRSVTTRNGKIVAADLVVPAVGPRPNTSFLSGLGSETLTSAGFVKVKPTLQLVNHSNIFAAGDIIEWDEQKQAAKTPAHSAIVAANIISLSEGRKLSKEYKKGPEAILITNGKLAGITWIGFFGGWILGNWFSSVMKGKNLFVTMTRKNLGY